MSGITHNELKKANDELSEANAALKILLKKAVNREWILSRR